MINNMDNYDLTKKMLSVIREGIHNNKTSNVKPLIEEESFELKQMLLEWNNIAKKMLNEESNGRKISITKSTPQFGDIRESQEEALIKTIGERIELGEDALVYYVDEDDLVLTGKIKSLNVAFQFRYNDPSGDGCYIWANALQMTDKNAKTVGKIKDAFDIWSKNLDGDADLMDKLKKAANK